MALFWSSTNQMRDRWVNLMYILCGGTKDIHRRNFDLLCKHPRVLSVFVSDEDRISVDSRPVYWRHPGTFLPYYLGRYRIILAPRELLFLTKEADVGQINNCFKVVCTESGRYDGVKGHVHSYENFFGEFCFGDRNEYLAQLLEQREYPTAIYLALDSLWNVGHGCYGFVEEKFKKPPLTVKQGDAT